MPFFHKAVSTGFLLLLILSTLLAACAPAPTAASAAPAATATAASDSTGVASPNPSPAAPTAESVKPGLFLPDYLPPALRSGIHPPADWSAASEEASADLSLRVGGEYPVSRWVYAAAMPFPTVEDDLDYEALKSAWGGQKTDAFFPTAILADRGTIQLFTALWGQPDPGMVQEVSGEVLVDRAWSAKTALAIIPFEDVQPRWKILAVDGQNPLRKSFDPQKYPLNVPFSLQGKAGAAPDPALRTEGVFPSTNRDPAKLTTVILTGVTALVRGTADLMERRGMDYPAEDIGDILREADVLHVNNEIPFTYKCPPPFMREDNLVFCSKPEYIQLLDDIGTDVIELAGDHFQDWGPEAVLESIDLYKKHNMLYYGGGLNLADGRKALEMTVNGNKIAFIGCNAKAPGYAGARENQPGAVHCDFDWLKQEIGRVKSEGYVPIATFQHLEYYSYLPHPILQKDFEAVASDGAVIASGSQAHQPQAMEFFNGSFLHFGLGNLFFDQYKEGIPERQAFLDRHVIYDNRYINTELITMQFVDLARARLMTPEERANLLRTVFAASGW